jgi:hypothetical protein
MNITNKKCFRYFIGVVFALSAMFLSLWTSVRLHKFLSDKELSSIMVLFVISIYFIAFVNIGIKIVRKILNSSFQIKQENIIDYHPVKIDEISYTPDILQKNEILHEYHGGTHLERDIYGKLWLHYEDDGLFNLLKGTPNRVVELWLLVDNTSDADYRVISLSHKQRCRPPYIALDIKGCFWAVAK